MLDFQSLARKCMKIQEMRSGIPRLSNKESRTGRDNVFEMRSITEAVFDDPIPPAVVSELESPIWSVISFDQRQAGGLTYQQAADLLLELDAYDIAGLCIITDSAAERLTKTAK